MKSKVKEGQKQLDGNTYKDDYIVEKILKKRKFPGGVKYLVKWMGFSNKETTWEPKEHFEQCFYLVVEYERRLKGKKKGRKLTCQRGLVRKSEKGKITSTKSFSENDSETDVIEVIEVISENIIGQQEVEALAGSSPSTGKTGRLNIFHQEECHPVPERILGVTHSPSGELSFVVKWSSDEGSVVTAKDAKVKWPQVVISFYEETYIRRFCSVKFSDGFEDLEDTADHKTRLLFLQQKSKKLKDS